MIGCFWMTFIVSFFLMISGLIVIITSYHPIGSPCFREAKDCDMSRSKNENPSTCYLQDCYHLDYSRDLSGIKMVAVTGFFLFLSFLAIAKRYSMDFINFPQFPRIRMSLEWQQSETSEVSTREQVMAATVSTVPIEMVNLGNLESGQEVKET